MIPVDTSPMTKLTAVTAMSMMFIGSRSCSSATCQTDGGFSPVISFGPWLRQTGRRLGLGQAAVGVGLEGGDDGRLVLREPRCPAPAGDPLGCGRGHGRRSSAGCRSTGLTRDG